MKAHDQKAETSTFPVSSIEFDKIYRVRQKRLEMGYTARELSFLLGYHPLYVRNLEAPTSTKKYNASETNYLRMIFDCPLSDLMLPIIEDPFYLVQVKQGINPASSNKYYSVSLLQDNTSHHFLSFEEEPAGFDLPLKRVASKQQIQDFVDKLFADGYFDEPRTGLKVFKHCICEFGSPLKPSFVADALGFYTGKRKVPRLVKRKNKGAREVFV